MTFPLDRSDERVFPDGWEGEIVTCDIDRTYLATRFSSLRGLARIPFEFGVDKSDIAGMVVLLKELRRGPGEASRHTPLYFVSASPVQLRPVIERKMLLDGIEHDGTTFKDWARVLLSGKLRRLREQVGYKLTALLRARRAFPSAAREILMGDDLEQDALTFALYADLLAGRLPLERLPRVLAGLGVADADAAHIGELAREAGETGGVRRICIRLERCAPRDFIDFAPHVAAAHGAFQQALAFLADGSVSLAGALRVASDLVARGLSGAELTEQLADSVRRGITPTGLAREVHDALAGRRLVAEEPPPPAEIDPDWASAAGRSPETPWAPLLRAGTGTG